MEITEASTDGLKRTLQVVIGAAELNERFSARLNEMKNQVNLKGFRKGKVPTTHLKKVYGKSVMADIVQQAVQEYSTKAIEERKERPALQPDIKLPEDQEEIERIINGDADLSYKISFEIIPDIKLADMSKFKLERLSVKVEDPAVDEALKGLTEHNTTFEVEEGRKAEDGDQLTIDFLGKIDGEAFEGGKGEDVNLVLGSNSFIPGFEQALLGAKAGDEPLVNVTFPDDYNAAHLAGKPATFETTVKSVALPQKPEISDAFAVAMGVENLDKLKDILRERISAELDQDARLILKRNLLDELDKNHEFELPSSLVDREFEQIWGQLTSSMEESKKTFEDDNTTQEEMRSQYADIARRRVRLGLVISEIGEQNKIDVTKDELRNAMVERARSYPGQEKHVFEFFEKNPSAVADLRAPLYEDKVVDFILELAKPTVKSVTREELIKEVQDIQDVNGISA